MTNPTVRLKSGRTISHTEYRTRQVASITLAAFGVSLFVANTVSIVKTGHDLTPFLAGVLR